jgi:hypothetical protein
VQAAARAAARAAHVTAAAGDLEDLGGGVDDEADAVGSAADPPDPAEIERLRRDLEARSARAQRTVADAQQGAARWQKKGEEGRALGSEAAAREAERNADLERARMHAALAELAELSAEREALDRAAAEAPRRRQARPAGRRPASAPPGKDSNGRGSPPPGGGERSVEDQLRDLKRGQAGPSTPGRTPAGTVDDELEALKRKMSGQKKRGKP